MTKSTDWPFNCMEILNLHCMVMKSFGYEISCTDTEAGERDLLVAYPTINTHGLTPLHSSIYCNA